jgi:hypothetical protein
MNMDRPSIYVYGNKYGESFIKEVLAGIEEEGVLCEVMITSEESAENLAFEAASASILEVGIGIDKELVCVTLAKLPAGESLLKYRTEEKQNLRLSGSNAARIVKGTSLKL